MVRLSPGASAPRVFAIDQLGRGRHGKKAYAERLIGSIRRKCVDHIVVFGEQHLRHALLSYMNHYKEVRTHLSLGKDAPVSLTAPTLFSPKSNGPNVDNQRQGGSLGLKR